MVTVARVVPATPGIRMDESGEQNVAFSFPGINKLFILTGTKIQGFEKVSFCHPYVAFNRRAAFGTNIETRCR